MRKFYLNHSKLVRLLLLSATIFPISATALSVTDINNLPPGAILNKTAKDVLDHLSDGSSTASATVNCNQNPYLSNAIPCKPAQSICPPNTEVIKPKGHCLVTTTPANTTLINSIFSGSVYSDINDSVDKTTNTLNCLISQYVPDASNIYGGGTQKLGYTPYCYYIGPNKTLKGIPRGYDSYSKTYDLRPTNDPMGNTFSVTSIDYNKATNWKCIPVTIKAKALCATIPTNINTLLQKLGKIK